jgi:O-antigen/teichoic acid export membrane protein
MSLRKRTINALAIIISGYGAQQVVRFGGNLITTRLLAPELFGAMLIANTVYSLVQLLTDIGLTMSVIKNKNPEEASFLKTVFSLKVLQGVILFILILLIALILIVLGNYGLLPSQSAFAHDDLPAAIAIVAIAALVNGFQSIQVDLRKRKQEFGKLTLLALFSQILSLLFIIISGMHSPSIYSLAFANVVSTATTCVGSYLIFERKYIGFAWDMKHVREVFSFGKWITASSAIVGLINSTDKFLFGYLLTASQMGLYAIASLISSAISRVFMQMNSSFFPALSEVLRDSPERASEVYYKIRFYRDIVTCFPAAVLITNGDHIISFLYDERYHDAGLFLQFLGIVPLVDAFLFKSQLITANGNSKIQFQTAIWRLSGMIVLIPVGFYLFGLIGALVPLVFRRVLGSWLLFMEFHRLGYLRPIAEVRTLMVIGGALIFGFSIRLIINPIIGI